MIDSLTTLAFDYPPRQTFFKKELVNYLLLARDVGFDPLTVKGSYAGAMGYGQFMPSSYRQYAVDFANDGVIDIINNPVDAIGSVANYLSVHGWRANEPIVVEATPHEEADASLANQQLKPKHTVAELRGAGYLPADTLDDAAMASLMALQGDEGLEYWLGLQNFYVITRYNHSRLYAMAVLQLSESFNSNGN